MGFQQRHEKERLGHRDICRIDRYPGRGNCVCKGPDVGVWLRRTKRPVYMGGVSEQES